MKGNSATQVKTLSEITEDITRLADRQTFLNRAIRNLFNDDFGLTEEEESGLYELMVREEVTIRSLVKDLYSLQISTQEKEH